jgi:Carboxypeptidase regulatory-like domain
MINGFLSRSTRFAWVWLVIMVCGAGMAAAADDALTTRLVEFGLEVEAQIETARHNLDIGRVDREMLTRQAEEAGRALEGLEQRVSGFPGGASESLALKLDAVRSQVANLKRAAELGSAPPRPSTTNPHIRHIGGNGGARSAPGNDDCADAIPVGMGTYFGDTSEATNDGEAICGSSLTTADVWFRFVLPESGVYLISTIGSSFDTVVSVHSGCPGTISNQIVCNDDYSGLQSMVKFNGYTGDEYLIRLSGSNGATGSFQLTISQGGSIEGTVTQAGSGLPVSTKVEIFNADSFYVGYDYTDTLGEYAVASIETGAYFVATDGSLDAVDQIYDGRSCPGGVPYGCDATEGDPVAVANGVTTSGIDFVLETGAAITGLVTSELTGLPIANNRVQLYNENGSSLSSLSTDATGVYTFENRNAGTYFVVARPGLYQSELYDDIPCPGGPPYGCDVLSGTPVVAQIGLTTSGIDFELTKLGAVTGEVTDRTTGMPLSFADVRVYDDLGNQVVYMEADSNAKYVAGGLEDGTYYIAAYKSYTHVSQVYDGLDCPSTGCNVLAGTPVVIDSYSTVAGIDFDLTTRGAITGLVLDVVTSQPATGVRVRLYNETGSSVGYDSTDTNGVFVVDRVYSGTYYVATDDSRYINQLYDGIPCPTGCTDPTSGNPVVVVNGVTTTGIDFSLVAKGEISGLVIADDSGETTVMRMELYDSTGGYVDYDYSGSSGYRFDGVSDGQYFVVADYYSNSYPYLGELFDGVPCWAGYPGGCDLTDGTPVVAAAGTATSGIDFSLKKRGKISGTVLDAADQSAVGGTVYARSVDGAVVTSDGLSGGIYSIGWLIPGDYLLVADGSYHRDEVWQDIPCVGEYPDHCDVSGGTPVTVSTGDEIVVNMMLDRLGSVSGVVRSAEDGSPLGSFYVLLYDDSGVQLAYDSSGYSSGEYSFSGIWPGTVFIATHENNLGYVDQLHEGISCPGGAPNGCDPTTGTPVAITVGTVAEIDFDLEPTSTISGRVTDAQTGLPLYGINVEAWDSRGVYRRYDSTDVSGFYEVVGLESGTFYVATDEYSAYSLTYIDMLYDGIPCPTGPPEGCDPTKGTPVVVVPGIATRFIDLALERRTSGVTGIVTDRLSDSPVAGIQIDLWDADTRSYALGTMTNAAGTYVANLDEGNYVVATDNRDGWVNQIWDGVQCVGGSAYNGDCDPMAGDVVVVEADRLAEHIDFALEGAVAVFADGFESGDTTRWSASTN